MRANFNKWQVYRPSYVPDVLVISISSNKTTLAYHDMWHHLYSKNYTVNFPKSFCGTSLFDFMLVKSCNRKSVMRIFCNMIIQFYYATLLYFYEYTQKQETCVIYEEIKAEMGHCLLFPFSQLLDISITLVFCSDLPHV